MMETTKKSRVSKGMEIDNGLIDWLIPLLFYVEQYFGINAGFVG